MNTGEVYVVTVGKLDHVVGEFYRPEVYVSEDVGRTVAGECMEDCGGRDRFVEVRESEPESHVVHRWDGPRCSVWLERLEVVR